MTATTTFHHGFNRGEVAHEVLCQYRAVIMTNTLFASAEEVADSACRIISACTRMDEMACLDELEFTVDACGGVHIGLEQMEAFRDEGGVPVAYIAVRNEYIGHGDYVIVVNR